MAGSAMPPGMRSTKAPLSQAMWSGSGWTESGLQLRLMQQLEKDRRRQRGCIGAGRATQALAVP